jgi:large subunit ribosomal protein L10
MDRAQKEAAVAELTEDLKGAEAIFAVDYRGISVTGAADLRRNLAEADAVFKVVKNRLAKRAAESAGTESLDELLVGPTALTLIHGDAVIAAKAIANFSREHGVLVYKGGFMDGDVLDPDGFTAIAKLPGVDALRGQLVGITASPLTGLVSGLSNMISGLGRQLAQIAEQGLVTGEAPAADEAPAEEAEEAPAAEAAEDTADEAPAEEPSNEQPATSNEDNADGEPSSDESEDTD